MKDHAIGAVVQAVRTLFEVGTFTGLSDGQLLECYLRRGDDSAEAAFRALVDRHGPMVLRVCRGILHDLHAAEDAFQATFLILARKAGAIRHRDSVASWLFGVARRVALRADGQRKRREARERRGDAMDQVAGKPSVFDDSFAEVQEEVQRLPEHYRAPVVLCYLEGLTQDEAAARLRLPASTVRVRLMRARAKLRDRLTRRGLTPDALAVLAFDRVGSVIPAPLVDETVKAAIRFAVGRAAGASGPAVALAEGVIRAMFLAKIKTVVALVATLMCASIGMYATLAGSTPAGRETTVVQTPDQAKKPEPKPRDGAPEVSTATVKKTPLVRSTQQPGTLEAFNTVDVYPKISGYLSHFKVDIGSRVKKGDVMVEILDPELKADVAKARAEVARAKARVNKAHAAIDVSQAALRFAVAQREVALAALKGPESQVEYRKKQLERLRELVQRGAVEDRLLPEEEDRYNEALSALKTSQAKVKASREAEVEAKANIQAARAELEEVESEVLIAQANLDGALAREAYTKIRSPYDGIVTRRHYHDGELVRSKDAGNSDPIVTIVQYNVMRVIVKVPERDAPFLDVGDPAIFIPDALGEDVKLKGRICRAAYALDVNDRTLRAEFDLPNPERRLRPGMYGRVEIDLETRKDVLTIPPGAFEPSGSQAGLASCFRVADGKAVATKIRLGGWDKERVEVLTGLNEGDIVVTNPPKDLKDGMPVKVKP